MEQDLPHQRTLCPLLPYPCHLHDLNTKREKDAGMHPELGTRMWFLIGLKMTRE